MLWGLYYWFQGGFRSDFQKHFAFSKTLMNAQKIYVLLLESFIGCLCTMLFKWLDKKKYEKQLQWNLVMKTCHRRVVSQ